jgi:hypothetical protein
VPDSIIQLKPTVVCEMFLLVVLCCIVGNTDGVKHWQDKRANTEPERSLLDQLLVDLGCGVGSCKRVGSLARAALRPPTESLKQIAKVSKDNAERDLHRWVQRQVWRQLMPAPYVFDLVLKDKAEHGTEPAIVPHFALLPHEVFHTLFTRAPDLFDWLLTGGDDNLRAWWRLAEEAKDSWYTDHPVIQSQPDSTKRVPLGLHGDDAGMSGQEQILVLTWNPTAVKRSTIDNRILFCMVKVTEIFQDVTLDTIFTVLKWSFEALATGLFPDRDHEGKLFSPDYFPDRYALRGKLVAGGRVGCWSEMRGDWKFLKEALHLQRHYGLRDFICHLCSVRKFGSYGSRYTNFRRDAPHRTTLYTAAAWLAIYLAAGCVSPILRIPGFNIWRVCFDSLHTYELGIFQYLVPSVMVELTSKPGVFDGSTKAERYSTAYRRYRVWCKTHRIKSVVSRKFVQKTWSKGKYPKISQLVAKGAALRSMVYWLDSVCREHTGNDHDAIRSAMVSSFVSADRICRGAGKHFTRSEHGTFCTHLEKALVAYNALAVESLELGQHLYKLIPKFHAGSHGYDVRLNPRRTSCYQDEDMVGRMKLIYCRCHGSTAAKRSMERYIILVCIRWWTELYEIRGIPAPWLV